MGKKRRSRHAGAKPQTQAPTSGRESGVAQAAAAGRGAKPGKWLAVTALVVAIGSAAFVASLWWDLDRQSDRPVTASPAPVTAVDPKPASAGLTAGPADRCRQPPALVAGLGFEGRPVIGTSLKGYTGLTLSELSPDGGIRQVYQHPTWDDAGSLGPYAYTSSGDVFVAPVPLVSLRVNPPERQNRVYRVDSATGEMSLFAELPANKPPNVSNPFGVLGLAYDCDTESLYVSSVAGSTFDRQDGRIFRLDLETGEAHIVTEGLDAFGIGVFNGAHGKRLYFGAARDSGVYSVALDAVGDAQGEIRREFYLAELEGGGNEKARRFRFSAPNVLTIWAYDFNYTLTAARDHRQRVYEFVYQQQTDTLDLKDIAIQTGPHL